MNLNALIAGCGLLAVASATCMATHPNPIPTGAIDKLQSTFMDNTLVVYWGIDATVAERADVLGAIQGEVIASAQSSGADIVRVSVDLVAAHAVLAHVEPTVVASVQDTDIFMGAQFDVSAFELQTLTIVDVNPQRVLVPVMLDGGLYTLELAPFSSRAPNFRVLIDDGSGQLIEIEAPAPKTWRGRVVEMPGSVVAASIDGQDMTASILLHDNPEDGWFIQPLGEVLTGQPAQQHIVYHGLASVSHGHECGGALLPDDVNFNIAQPQNLAQRSGLLVCEMAYDGDFQFYTQNGSSVNNTIADIENVQNGMIVVYERDCGITFVTTEIIVRTSSGSNPYTSNNAETLLNQFRNHWNANHTNVHRDLAHLMTGRNMGGVLGIAWLGVVCSNSLGYGVSRSRFTSNYNQRVALTAHEVGHNFNCGHCSGSTCRIMCASLGGCGGIGLPNFSTNSANIISNYAAARWCLDKDGPPPNEPPTVFITTPFNGSVHLEGDLILFSVLATDPEDGNIAADVIWTSSLDGPFGTGGFFQYSQLTPGVHTINASVTDSGGLGGEHNIQITVNAAPDPCPADRNGDGELDFFDVQNFLDAFANQHPSADMNGDGNFDFFDVQIYLDLFSQGCP